jgi:hypothetical protein
MKGLEDSESTEFEYIKNRYGVPAEMHREVIVDGKKGVITKDMGGYIGVHFYDKKTVEPSPCHPTWEVQYLESFNYKPPIEKMTASKRRYRDWLNSESGLTFSEWLGIKPKEKKYSWME